MDNISYHGTTKAGADSIVGPPQNFQFVGRGELGKGFYSGSSLAIAVSWAFVKADGAGAHVIEIEIPKTEFVKLKPIICYTPEEVQELRKKLRKEKTNDIYIIGECDYVMAPFATIREVGIQFKFESEKAQQVLNKSKLNILPCD